MINKEKYITDINNRFTEGAKKVLLSQVELFYMNNQDIKKTKYDINDDVKLTKGTFIHGIFGEYRYTTDNLELVKVGKSSEVKIGNAYIYTVLESELVEEFEINITDINETSDTKNITFEITDEKLIEKTGGVVQGMSGSPVIQNNKIIGVVTHVIVDNPVKGYGLFITKMLEEGEN